MKAPKRGADSAAPQATPPLLQRIDPSELIDRMQPQDKDWLLDHAMDEARAHYFRSWHDWQAQHEATHDYRKQQLDRFRGTAETGHPMFRGRWASSTETINPQLALALKAKDWQEVMVLAGMLCVRDMLYGRAAEPKAAEKPKVAAKKLHASPARKKPAAATRKKKPLVPAHMRSPTRKGKILLLDIVAQAKPLFKTNPNLTREQLIAKIPSGRAYERLTTFAELKTLAAGKTVTRHSLKKPAASRTTADDLVDAEIARSKAHAKAVGVKPAVDQWPFPTSGRSITKAKAPPAKTAAGPPAAAAQAAVAKAPTAARTKPWPKPDATGKFTADQADHVADFGSGAVVCDFAAIETEDGWTYGFNLKIGDRPPTAQPLSEAGPLAPDADVAIRDASTDMLSVVKLALEMAESKSNSGEDDIGPHVPDLEKLRSWLLGFQARGVEKIAFLHKGNQKQLELAA